MKILNYMSCYFTSFYYFAKFYVFVIDCIVVNKPTSNLSLIFLLFFEINSES